MGTNQTAFNDRACARVRRLKNTVFGALLCLTLSSCVFMPELGSSLLTSTVKTVSNESFAQCDDKKGKNFYLASVNPVLETKCAACHASLAFRITRGGAESNYTFAKSKGANLVEYATARKTHPGGAVLASADESLISKWFDFEAECRTNRPAAGVSVCSAESRPAQASSAPGNNTNAARTSGDGLFLRLSSLFPGQSINQNDFSLYASTGLNRAIALPQRFTSVSAQIAFLAKIESLCSTGVGTPKTLPGALFGDFRLSNETVPSDVDARDVLYMSRNIWLYPYEQNSKEYGELMKAYTNTVAAVKAEGKSDTEAKKIGKITACVAALQAPQFWLGNSGPFDVLRKTAIEVGRVLPTPGDFAAFKAASDRSQWMRAYVANLQHSSSAGYLNAIKYWHKDWLGSRPFSTSLDPRIAAGGQRDSTAPAGASRIMGVIGEVVAFGASVKGTALENQTRLGVFAGEYTHLVHNSEACENKIQDFDPRTTKIVWEQKNPAVGGAYEVIGSWEKQNGAWVSVPGSVTLSNGSKRATSVADVNLGLTNKGTAYNGGVGYRYNIGKLVGTPMEFFAAADRRVRRFSPSGEQNGYSAVNLRYSDQTVYVCNTLTRFVATCAYRPNALSNAILPTSSYTYDESNRGTSKLAAWNGEGIATINNDGSYGKRDPRPFVNYNSMVNTFAHGAVLDQMKCGVPNADESARIGLAGYSEDTAFPKGYDSETSTTVPRQDLLNTLAYNIHYRSNTVAAGAELTALQTIAADISNDASRLIEHVLDNELDYRQILLANYTFGSDYLKELLASQNFTLPFRAPAAELSSSPTTVKKITQSSLGTLNKRWLQSIQGTTPLPASWTKFLSNGTLNKYGDNLQPKPIQGILTTSELQAPVSPGIRTLATRIVTRLMCMELPVFVPDSSQNALHTKYVTFATHLKPGCINCHINLDPLASALNANFAAKPSLRSGGDYATELEITNGLYGIRGVANPGEGALLGKPVRGLAGVAEVVANSDQFARCSVQKAFENIFGRPVPTVADCKLAPTHADCLLVDEITKKFKGELGYNYNRMIQELVASPLNLKGN